MEQEIEIWKDIKDYEGLYQVSDLGRIKSLPKKWIANNNAFEHSELIMKPSVGKQGYNMVVLRKNGKVSGRLIHRLVYETFKGKTEYNIDHIKEGNRSNNRLDNLQAIPQRQNVSKYYLSKPKSSKYTGVYFTKKRNNWLACIRINGKLKHLGRFKTEIEAHNAYQNELKKTPCK